jgi:hypothetical protein
MGFLDASRSRPDCGRMARDFRIGYAAHSGLLRADYRHYAAERFGRRPGRCFRRRGQPNGFWTARRGHIFVARDDLVRDRFYDDLAHLVGKAYADRPARNRLDSRTDTEVRNSTGACKAGAIATGTISASADSSANTTTRASSTATSARAESCSESKEVEELVLAR